jgi:hypothetical protein
VQEDRGAVIVGVIAQDDAEPVPAQQPRQPLLAVDQRQARRFSPSSSNRSKAYSMASLTVPPVEHVEDRDTV